MDFDSLINETKISFSCKDLKDDDIVEILAEVLEKSSVVTEIDLMLNQLTLSDDIFTDALAMNKSLKVLNLYNNKIGVEGAKRLAKAIANHETLEQLNLERAEICDEGVKHLAEALKKNSSLEVLILRGNKISDDGAVSLMTALLFNSSLRVLLLGQNNISDDGAEKLAELIGYNSVLDQIMLDFNNVSTLMDMKVKNAMGNPSRKIVKEEPVLPKWLVESMLAFKDATIKTIQDEKSILEAKIDCRDQEIALLRQLEDEIIIMDRKVTRRDDALAVITMEMSKKDETISSMATEISSLKSSLQRPLELLSELLQQKDEEISSLKLKCSFGEISSLQAKSSNPLDVKAPVCAPKVKKSSHKKTKSTPKSSALIEISFSPTNNKVSTSRHFFSDDDPSENLDPRSPKSAGSASLKKGPMSPKTNPICPMEMTPSTARM